MQRTKANLTTEISVLGLALSAAVSTADAAWDKDLVTALNERGLCATKEFVEVEIDVLDGIRSLQTGDAFRVRVGDRLTFVDAGEHEDGYELELLATSPGLRTEEAEITIFLTKPAVANTARNSPLDTRKRYAIEFVNWEELDQALALFTQRCEPAALSSPEQGG